MDNATIFFSEKRWLAGEKCFGSRFEGQSLPAVSIGCGFLTATNEVVDPPHLKNDLQTKDLKAVLENTRDILQNGWQGQEDVGL